MTFKVTVTSQNLKKIIFLPRLMKLCILVAYKFLIKNLNFGVNQCISGHVLLQNMKFIRLVISQPFLKIETSGLDQKILENYAQNISRLLGSSSAFLVT